MQAQRNDDVTHGPYLLVVNPLDDGGSMSIRRQDADHKRTVAFVDHLWQWDRFVAALEGGMNEVQAVWFIDHEDEMLPDDLG